MRVEGLGGADRLTVRAPSAAELFWLASSSGWIVATHPAGWNSPWGPPAVALGGAASVRSCRPAPMNSVASASMSACSASSTLRRMMSMSPPARSASSSSDRSDSL